MRRTARSSLSRFAKGLLLAGFAATFLTAGSVVCQASPANPSLKETLEGLQRHYRETKSFSAKFVEEISPVGAPKRTRTGTVYFRKPGQMRWEFEEPSKELIVSDGIDVYNYDPELNQVVEAPLAQALRSPGATEFLLGVGDITKDFNASLMADAPADGLTHLKLVPKKQGNTVELGLEAKSYNIESIRVIDQLGNVTALRFTDIASNGAIQDSIFKFTPPAGADIVHPTSPK
jgi:outer membrane lipoprotein carrier protein